MPLNFSITGYPRRASSSILKEKPSPPAKPIGKEEMEAFSKKRDNALTWLKEDVPSGILNRGLTHQ
jgi:hypothetical protein